MLMFHLSPLLLCITFYCVSSYLLPNSPRPLSRGKVIGASEATVESSADTLKTSILSSSVPSRVELNELLLKVFTVCWTRFTLSPYSIYYVAREN